jgi:hypothetical protein
VSLLEDYQKAGQSTSNNSLLNDYVTASKKETVPAWREGLYPWQHGFQNVSSRFYNRAGNLIELLATQGGGYPHGTLADAGRWAAKGLRGIGERVAPTGEVKGFIPKLASGTADILGEIPLLIATGPGAPALAALEGGLDADQTNPLAMATGAAQGALTLKSLQGLSALKSLLARTAVGGGTFGGLAAAQGSPTEDVAAQTVLGAIMSLPGGGKTANEQILAQTKGYRPSPEMVAREYAAATREMPKTTIDPSVFENRPLLQLPAPTNEGVMISPQRGRLIKKIGYETSKTGKTGKFIYPTEKNTLLNDYLKASEGEELGRPVPIEGTGGETPTASGVVQTQGQVKPRVLTPDEIPFKAAADAVGVRYDGMMDFGVKGRKAQLTLTEPGWGTSFYAKTPKDVAIRAEEKRAAYRAADEAKKSTSEQPVPQTDTSVPEISTPVLPDKTVVLEGGTPGNMAPSRRAERTEAVAVDAKLTEGFEGLAKYAKEHQGDWNRVARELVEIDPIRADRIAMGKESSPVGTRDAAVFGAVEERATKAGDVETLRRLATESTVATHLSEYGKEIKAADSGADVLDSPVRVMQDISKTRAEESTRTGRKRVQPAEVERLRTELETAQNALSARLTEKVAKREPIKYGAKNKIVTLSDYEITKAKLRERFSGTQLNVGIDPEVIKDLGKIGTYHFEAGTRAFAEWSARMVEDTGEWVKPYLNDLWKQTQNDRRQRIGLKTQKTRLANEAKKLTGKLENLDFTKQERRAIALDPEAMVLKAKRDRAKENYQMAAKAAGVVTKEEATEIVRLSQVMSDAKIKMEQGGNRLVYGAARVVLQNYADRLKGVHAPIKTILKNRTGEFGTTWKENPVGAVGGVGLDAAKVIADNSVTLVSTLDNSFIGSQGVYTFGTHPVIWYRAAIKSFADFAKTIGGKNAHDALMADVYSRPRYMSGEYQKAGLLPTTEEPFPGTLAQRIPGVGRVLTASEYAFTGSATRMRLGTYDLLADRAIKNGVDWNINQQKAFGKLCSSLTARGTAKWTNSPIIRLVMWAPKMLKGQYDILTMHSLGAGLETPRARFEAAKNLLKLTVETASFMTLCNYLKPGSAETDPRSSAFGTVKIGGTNFLYGTKAIGLVVLASRLITGETKNAVTGKITKLEPGYGKRTRLDVLYSFVTNKFNPPASVLRDALRGTFFDQTPFTWGGAIYRAHTPIFLQNVINLKDNKSAAAVAGVITDGLGVQATTYTNKIRGSSKPPSGKLPSMGMPKP